jgi:uncharacterized Zn-finger protein
MTRRNFRHVICAVSFIFLNLFHYFSSFFPRNYPSSFQELSTRKFENLNSFTNHESHFQISPSRNSLLKFSHTTLQYLLLDFESALVMSVVGRSEEESKPYKCQYEGCGKRFTKSSNLTQHLRIHSGMVMAWHYSVNINIFFLGEKPFQCDLCGRSFRQSGNLTKHLKSHENAHLRWNRSTSEKPFKCPHEGCDKSFTAKSSLQNHIRSHSEEAAAEVPHLMYMPKTDVINTGATSAVHQFSFNPTSSFPVVRTQKDRLPTKYQCIHPNCKKSFFDESELRAHLIAYNPGMAAENQYLRECVVKLVGYIDEVNRRSSHAVVS